MAQQVQVFGRASAGDADVVDLNLVQQPLGDRRVMEVMGHDADAEGIPHGSQQLLVRASVQFLVIVPPAVAGKAESKRAGLAAVLLDQVEGGAGEGEVVDEGRSGANCRANPTD